MASIISRDFNTGPNGASATTTQLGASSQTGTAPVYSNTDPVEGAFDLFFPLAAGNSSVRWDFTADGDLWLYFYFKTPATPPASNQSIGTWYSGDTNQVGSLRLNSDMRLAIRDVASATQTTTAPLPADSWCRVAVHIVPGSATGHVAKVYAGSQRHSTTPTETLTTSATNSGMTTVDNVRLGNITGGAEIHIDHLRVDDTSEPAPLSGVGGPTVSAGPDLTKETGGAPFVIVGTEVPGAAAIVARNWRVVSGTSVTLTNANTKDVTVTPPATTGSTVLGFTATDANAAVSPEDTMTITWVAPGQAFRPASDVAAASWTATPSATPMTSNIDEIVADSSDYVQSPNNPTAQEYKFRLAGQPAPASTTGVVLEVQLWLSAAATSQSTVVTLYDSDATTVRKTQTFTDLTTTPTVKQISLTSGEAAAITGWTSGLVVGVKPTVS